VRPEPEPPRSEAAWPTWRYWAGVLVALPALLVPAVYVWTADSRVPQSARVVPTLVVVSVAIAVIVRERHVRTMAGGQRATWAFIGLVLAFTVCAALAGVLLLLFLGFGCTPEDRRCFD
jgi:hypothetical protein